MEEDELLNEIAVCEALKVRSEFEAEIAKDVDIALRYVADVLAHFSPQNRRFHLAEDLIAQMGIKSLNYAIMIGQQFPKGEDAIKKSADFSFKYAFEVVKGSWHEGEASIISDSPCLAFKYATEVIKGRWIPGEDTICSESRYLRRYSKFLDCRFPQYESNLEEDDILSYMVNNSNYHIPELEKRYIQYCKDNADINQMLALEYCVKVLKGPWPELEAFAQAEGLEMPIYEKVKQRAWKSVQPSHQCEAVNVGFTTVRYACKHCGRDM